jgi:hypothetical protein
LVEDLESTDAGVALPEVFKYIYSFLGYLTWFERIEQESR